MIIDYIFPSSHFNHFKSCEATYFLHFIPVVEVGRTLSMLLALLCLHATIWSRLSWSWRLKSRIIYLFDCFTIEQSQTTCILFIWAHIVWTVITRTHIYSIVIDFPSSSPSFPLILWNLCAPLIVMKSLRDKYFHWFEIFIFSWDKK